MGPANPAFSFHGTDFYAQGLNLGAGVPLVAVPPPGGADNAVGPPGTAPGSPIEKRAKT